MACINNYNRGLLSVKSHEACFLFVFLVSSHILWEWKTKFTYEWDKRKEVKPVRSITTATSLRQSTAVDKNSNSEWIWMFTLKKKKKCLFHFSGSVEWIWLVVFDSDQWTEFSRSPDSTSLVRNWGWRREKTSGDGSNTSLPPSLWPQIQSKPSGVREKGANIDVYK